MKPNVQPKVKIRMPRRSFQRMDMARPGSTLFCEAGVLWVTQSGDRRDYVLLPGDKMTVTNRGKVLVEAMRDTDLYIA